MTPPEAERLLEEDADTVMEIIQLRNFKDAFDLVQGVSERKVKLEDLPAENPLVQRVFDIEFSLAQEEINQLKADQEAEEC
mgnify:FL=1